MTEVPPLAEGRLRPPFLFPRLSYLHKVMQASLLLLGFNDLQTARTSKKGLIERIEIITDGDVLPTTRCRRQRAPEETQAQSGLTLTAAPRTPDRPPAVVCAGHLPEPRAHSACLYVEYPF
jgi:hypothetical protein